MRLAWQLSALVFTALFVASIGARVLPTPHDVAYTGSAACESCHRSITAEWRDSLHTKMMRPVEQPGAVVADLSHDIAAVPFDPDEAHWAIGGKWEQQFMGHERGTETLLPGAWEVGHERWKRKGWDGWRVPEPLRRCHGCHTVGLDVETGEFVEPSIGCESCHGPGGWHVTTLGLGKIHSSGDAQVCGQCHTRGTDPTREFFFPVGYRPGAELASTFVELQPSYGQNSSFWWGNGSERKRHQEFAAWRRGGHSQSLASLREGYDGRYGELTDDCLRCHSGDYILGGTRKPTLTEAEFGITCSVCHEVHGRLDERRMDCAECHEGGAFYHEPEKNASHVACPSNAAVGCVGCHMPLVVRNGGGYTLHSHAPGVVTPAEAARWGMPSSCANGGCHSSASPQQLQESFDAFYGHPAVLEAPAADSPAAPQAMSLPPKTPSVPTLSGSAGS